MQGPNGFVRNFVGNSLDDACQGIQSYITYKPDQSLLFLYMGNEGLVDAIFEIYDNAYGSFDPQTVSVLKGTSSTLSFNISSSGNWYDLSISVSSCYSRRSMGRMETDEDSISDPAISEAVPGLWDAIPENNNSYHQHPILPLSIRTIKRQETKFAFTDKDAKFKSIDASKLMSDYF